jgi:DNA-binding transcriptional ArsR family regulator
MTKITLDRETFKALASDTRLDILKALDGKNLGLNEIANISNLNKATLHEHLAKLNEAGLIKRNERDGHKWVYYKLTWKGECLLHPENTKIVVLFTTTFVALWIGIIQLIWYIKGTIINSVSTAGDRSIFMVTQGKSFDLSYNSFIQASPSPGVYGLPDPIQNLLIKARLGYSGGAPLYSPQYSMDGSTNPTTVSSELSRNIAHSGSSGVVQAVYQNPLYLNIALGCFIVFTIILGISVWRMWENRTPKL